MKFERSRLQARLAYALAALSSSALLGGGVLAAPARASFSPVTKSQLSATVTLSPRLAKKRSPACAPGSQPPRTGVPPDSAVALVSPRSKAIVATAEC